jgi:hypothetical protein
VQAWRERDVAQHRLSDPAHEVCPGAASGTGRPDRGDPSCAVVTAPLHTPAVLARSDEDTYLVLDEGLPLTPEIVAVLDAVLKVAQWLPAEAVEPTGRG